MGLKDMLRALFPCGSVTGAPKVRAMEIINELEADPRGVYTGAIGHIAPSGDAQFNVAIRTVVLDAQGGEMGIGSGIVADSKADAEFEECLLKAQFLTRPDAPFSLIETIRYERGKGLHLLERHLARLQSSAAHFGYPFSREKTLAALDEEAARVEAPVAMLRLLLAEDGAITVTSTAIELPTKGTVWRFVISDQRLDEKDPVLLPQDHAAAVLRPRDGAAEGADRLRRGRLPQQEGRAHRGHAHQSLHRDRRAPVHAGSDLRASSRHAARGAARSAARGSERSGVDAAGPARPPTASISAIRCAVSSAPSCSSLPGARRASARSIRPQPATKANGRDMPGHPVFAL